MYGCILGKYHDVLYLLHYKILLKQEQKIERIQQHIIMSNDKKILKINPHNNQTQTQTQTSRTNKLTISKKRRILDQILNQQSSVCPKQNPYSPPPSPSQSSNSNTLQNQYFQAFTYNDHITNNAFYLNEQQYIEGLKFQNIGHSRSGSNVNVNGVGMGMGSKDVNLNMCYNLMKTTRKFHISSIRQKNYKVNHSVDNINIGNNSNSHRSNNSDQNLYTILQAQIDTINRQKYKIRKRKERLTYNQEKSQLSRILSKDISYLHHSKTNSIVNQCGSDVMGLGNFNSANVSVETSPRDMDRHGQQYQGDKPKPQQQKQAQTKKQIQKQNELQQVIRQFQKSVQENKLKKQKQKRNQNRNNNNGYNNCKSNDNKPKRFHSYINLQNLSIQQQNILNKLNRQIRRQITKNVQYLVEPKSQAIGVSELRKFINKYREKDKQKHDTKGYKNLFKGFTEKQSFFQNKKVNFANSNGCNHENYTNLKGIGNFQQQNQYQDKFMPIKKQIYDYTFKIQDQNEIIHRYKLQNPHNHKNQLKRIPNLHCKSSTSPTIMSINPSTQTPSIKQDKKNLIQQIKSGNFHKIQIDLSLKPELLHTKQPNTLNNLLHLCIKYNHPHIFCMIVKKCLENQVDLLSQVNKFNKSPNQLRKVYRHFNERVFYFVNQFNCNYRGGFVR